MGRPFAYIYWDNRRKSWLSRTLAFVICSLVTSTALAQVTGPLAVVLKHGIELNGNGFYADSYDSSDSNKSTFGKYDATKYSGNQGNLLAFDGLIDSFSMGNALIYGTLHTAPGSPVYLGPSGGIGPHGSQVNDVTTARALGYIAADANIVFPEIGLPFDYPSYLTPTAGSIVTWSNSITSWSTNSTVPPSSPPWGGVLTNVTYNYTSVYPQPPPPGLVTNVNYVTGSPTLPNPPPANVTTNYTTTTTTSSSYPGAGTYLGTVTTNYVGGTGKIASYTYNHISGYTYSYILYTYGIPYYTYTYSLYQTNTVYYTNSYDHVLNANTKYVANSLAGTVLVAGPNVTAVLPNGLTGAETFTFNQGASLNVYAGGTWATINGNQYLNPKSYPASFVLYCASSVAGLTLNGNGSFSGVLVAPSAQATLNGGGNSNEDFCGALMASSLKFNGHYSFHYDEALSHTPPLLQITQQPLSQSALAGSTVILAVSLAAPAPLVTYQWRFNGISLPGANASTLVLPHVQSNTLGNFDVVIRTPFNSLTSQVATVSLTPGPDFLWARSGSNVLDGGAYSGSWADALAAETRGNVLVAGRFSAPSLDLGGIVLSNSAGNNFLCKYDHSGNLQWATQAGSLPASALPHLRVGTDATGNVYWAGHFTGTADFGGLQLTNAGTADLFLAKLNPAGQVLWARQIGAYNPQDYTPTFGFAVDAAGSVFLAGSYAGAAILGSLTVTNTGGFLAKYDAAGGLLWATDAPPAQALALSPSGALYLALSGGAGTLAKYDSQGQPLWSKPFPRANALAVDAHENLYATGYGAGTFDGVVLTNVNGLPDFFVGRCDASGTVQWLRQVGSTRQQRGLALALDRCGAVFVSSVAGDARPDPVLGFGSFSLTNVSAFVAEYDTAGNALWAQPLVTPQAAPVWGLDALAPGVMALAGSYHPALTLGNITFAEAPGSLGTYFVAQLAGLTPPQLAAAVPWGGAPFHLTVEGTPGFRCVLEGSTNLWDWTPLVTNTAPFSFSDEDAANYLSRFYRASYRP